MDGETPEIILTDPPYSSGGFQESGKTSGSIGARGSKKIENDNLSTRGYERLMNAVLTQFKPAHTIFVFCDWKMWINNFDLSEGNGYRVRNMIVWDKVQMGMGMPFRNQHELCLFGSKLAGKIGNGSTPNVLQFTRDREAEHATPKPVELLERLIKQVESDTITDPFAGGGSAFIAAEKTGRTCYGMELDPKYCDVIVKRWEDFTGKKAELVS
jgi:DNA modification methylase